MRKFNEHELTEQLGLLDKKQRVLFSITCVERLFPGYASFAHLAGKAPGDIVRSTLDRLWAQLTMADDTQPEFAFLEEYESLLSDEAHPWSPFEVVSDNLVSALVHGCRCARSGECGDAVRVAVQAYDTVDHVVQTIEGLDFKDDDMELKILQHDFVQAELERQHRDLVELQEALGKDLANVAARFRERAVAEGVEMVSFVSKMQADAT